MEARTNSVDRANSRVHAALLIVTFYVQSSIKDFQEQENNMMKSRQQKTINPIAIWLARLADGARNRNSDPAGSDFEAPYDWSRACKAASESWQVLSWFEPPQNK